MRWWNLISVWANKNEFILRLICERNGKENAKTKTEREKQKKKKENKKTNKKVKPRKYSYRFSYIFVRSIVTTFNLQQHNSYVWMFGYVGIDASITWIICMRMMIALNQYKNSNGIWKCIWIGAIYINGNQNNNIELANKQLRKTK